MTRKPLRVLLVEDCETDAELLIHALEDGGYDVVFERVDTADGLRAALGRQPWELVLSDYSLPGFSAPAALAIVQELRPEMPFIIVSGTVGEDTAGAALKAGAVDFLVKGRLVRLIPAIERELREVKLRNVKARERDALEEQLRQSQKLEGLGLATVYGATQQLGGHVAVTSQVGHGTTFTLYFPGATDATEEMTPAALTPKSTKALAQHREVVLVVEDQRAVRQLVSRMLVRHGYTVLEAGGAAEALTLFEQHRATVDLLLTDVVMPKMGGPELANQLCALKPGLRVIFISGFTGEDISRRGPLARNATIVEKPFTAAALLQAVRDALDNDAGVLTLTRT